MYIFWSKCLVTARSLETVDSLISCIHGDQITITVNLERKKSVIPVIGIITSPTTMTAPDVATIYFLNSLEPNSTEITVFATSLEMAASMIASTATFCGIYVPPSVAMDKVIASTSASPEMILVA